MDAGTHRYATMAVHIPSWVNDRFAGNKHYYQFAYTPPLGHVKVSIDHTDISPSYTSQLGFEPDPNLNGNSINISQNNNFEKGEIESYFVSSSVNSYQYYTGGFFKKSAIGGGSINTRHGYSLSLNTRVSQRDQYHDHTNNYSFDWGNKTLYQHGSTGMTIGNQAGLPYRFWRISQGLCIAKNISMQLSYNAMSMGDFHTKQMVTTGTYRLNAQRTIGIRYVQQDRNGNIYFSYQQHVTSGADIFLLYGDPNANTTRSKITLKIVNPISW